MAQKIDERALDDATLRLAAGYDKLFLKKTVKIEFSEQDSSIMLDMLAKETKKLRHNPRISAFGAEVLMQKIREFMQKIQEMNPVEIDRDDFQVLSLAISDYDVANLFKESSDLAECLAQVARMFMGIDGLKQEKLRHWLIREMLQQYGDTLNFRFE